MTALLRLEHLARRFGGLTAVHPVSLTVEAGTRHAVIGPNGAGKTTLLHLIAGTLRPSRGTIVFDDRDITRLSAPARARHGIGRTFQHPAIFDRLTVTANLALAHERTGRRTRRGRLRDRAALLVDDAGLSAYATVPAGQLPYGLQRRLELAMALATRPRLLLLDEPSAGLDPDEVTHLAHLLTTQPDDVSILIVDHHLDVIWALAHTVTVLHHGRHLTTASPDTVRADPQVQNAYLPTTYPPSPARPVTTTVGPALLRVRHLRAGYHGTPVINGVDLDVHEGEAVAVLGRNGTGKTTLLNAIAGLLPPQPPSHLTLAGQPLIGRRAHQVARAGLAIVPQGRRLFAPLTVTEHLTTAAQHGRPHTHPGPMWTVPTVLDLLPALATRLRHPAHRLSGGEQQMLALARALLTQPRLLILDEPSEGLAPTVISQLTATLAALISHGLAVLIAEQNLTLAGALTHRVIVLDHGHIAMTCLTHQLDDSTHRRHLHTRLGIAPPNDVVDDPQPVAARKDDGST